MMPQGVTKKNVCGYGLLPGMHGMSGTLFLGAPIRIQDKWSI
jgi:hypothetical protein